MTQVSQRVAAVLTAVIMALALSSPAEAQVFPRRVELSGNVHLDEVDGGARAHLERVKACLADQQWDEAVEILRQVMENYGGKVIAITERRYVNVWDYCHMQIAGLPPEALALYRERVDPVAQKWYEEGVERHSAARLSSVVNQFFASSWGDDALWTLGEMALEKGDYGAARGHWEKLLERPPEKIPAARFDAVRNQPDLDADLAKLISHWYFRDETPDPPVYRLRHDEELADATSAALVKFWKGAGLPLTRLAFPESSIPAADVRARLVLASILEGSWDRARGELQAFERLHRGAEGMLGGRKVRYAEALASLLESARSWPSAKSTRDWATFAGAPTRTTIAPPLVDLGAKAWPPINLGEAVQADVANSRAYTARRTAEDSQALLSYHPLVVGGLILVCNRSSIFAFDLRTGKPAWPSAGNESGQIYSEENIQPSGGRTNRVGVPRFTMTAHAGRLYARMGSQVTNRPIEAFESHKGYLVCIDLTAQGRLVWKISPDDEKWSFEGAPLSDGENVYVGMRKSDVRPQAYVACFDAESARLRWRVLVCSSESPGGGQIEEMTHNLLTLDHGSLYYNTNLGALAAINTADGQIRWATLYTRAGKPAEGESASHFYRDLNPCIYHRGIVIAAPSDSETIVGVDAASGQILWETYLAHDAVHLLGVSHNNLIASGNRLWWFDVYTGKVLKRWPDTTPTGYGRGLLAGEAVLWPTREALHVLDQQVDNKSLAARPPIALALGRGATGGNLVIGDGLLLIAAADKLYAFERRAGREAAESTTSAPRQKNAAAADSTPGQAPVAVTSPPQD